MIGEFVAVVCALAVLYFLKCRFIDGPESCISSRDYKKFRLFKKVNVNHNTKRLAFALPTGRSLGLPVGRHVSLRAGIKGTFVARSYTPVSSNDDTGFFELVVKVYDEGVMSKHLGQMRIGDYIDVAGPRGKFEYHGNGACTFNKETRVFKDISMIAGGTGITPMLQILKEVLKYPTDTTRVQLVFANVTEEDILLKDEIESLAEKHSRFTVFFTLDKPVNGWTGGKGFVTTEMMAQHLAAPCDQTIVLVCGPPPMVKAMELNSKNSGYKAHFSF